MMKTSTGFEFELSEEVLDDWELLEQLAEIDAGNTGAVVGAAKALLGDDYDRLKDHVRGKSGRVSAKAMAKEIEDIFNATKTGKNF